jgi:hypothetical protein
VTDRELLELAAKAAGIELKPMEMMNVTEQGDDRFIGYMADPAQCPRGWFDPLRDDGDALRLAMRLKMALDLTQLLEDTIFVGAFASRVVQEVTEKVGDDPAATTRRAIVRAAAEIGRAMT